MDCILRYGSTKNHTWSVSTINCGRWLVSISRKKRETQMPLPLATSLRAVERLTNHQSESHSLAAENLVNCHSLWLPPWDSYWVILWWQSQKGVQIPLRPTVLVYKTFKYIFYTAAWHQSSIGLSWQRAKQTKNCKDKLLLSLYRLKKNKWISKELFFTV